MPRTSLTHPLRIAEIPIAGPHRSPADGGAARRPEGLIGITFCPGKVDPHGHTGEWQRDLDTDLDAVADWRPDVVLTLMEAAELERLEVPVERLRAGLHSRGVAWLHLPIVDAQAPGAAFEAAWPTAGKALRRRLRDGQRVLVHCRGGLGRAGTVAARLLIELGWDRRRAIAAVREVRPGAIETAAQERHLENCAALESAVRLPAGLAADIGSPDALQDRAIGALLGLAVGDAVGTTLEFLPRDTYRWIDDMVGGGPFRLQPGEWTDDTAMALALADSLAECGTVDPPDLMRRFAAWMNHGTYSCTGHCFDIGRTTLGAISRYMRTGEPLAGATADTASGNGSLMRLAPVALRWWDAPDQAAAMARLQSRTTHGSAEAVDACAYFARLLSAAIAGQPRDTLLGPQDFEGAPRIARIAAGSWRGRHRDTIDSSGYVVATLEAAIWAVAETRSFRDAILLAANLGSDADTVAAVAGQLAGALYGASAIPHQWRFRLAWGDRIEAMGLRLVAERGS